MSFKQYRKTTPTVARVLTQDDVTSLGGVIQTNEGPRAFVAGDYLASDAKGVWPIKKETIEKNYRLVGTSRNGWSTFQPLDTREACQMAETFTVDGLTGQPGDYLVRSGGKEWPVAKAIFESSYELVEQG